MEHNSLKQSCNPKHQPRVTLKSDATYGKQLVQCIRDAQVEFAALMHLHSNYLPQSSVLSEKEIQVLINAFIGCRGLYA